MNRGTGRRTLPLLAATLGGVLAVAGCQSGSTAGAPASSAPASSSPAGASAGATPSSTPPASSAASASASPSPTTNVYAAAAAGMISATAARAKPLVYVPDTLSNRVDVIDPATYKVIRSFPVPATPQHVIPSWDLKTLWVAESGGDSLTPVDPVTGRPGKNVPVADPYNMYFTENGKEAMVMAERLHRIDFRDPHTMKLNHSLHVPCDGINHADFTADRSAFLTSCEFSGKLLVAAADGSKILKVIDLNPVKTPGAVDPAKARRMGGPASALDQGASSMPQDVRLTPDGSTFLIADMLRNGVWEVDAHTMKLRGFLHTGQGAHGIYPSRDGNSIYVSNRDEGSVSVVDAATLKVSALWKIPGGGSPDMGDVSADGSQLWLAGRYNSEVYVFDTRTGKVIKKIPVGNGPHGLCVWPQPGRFSLGHTGNMR